MSAALLTKSEIEGAKLLRRGKVRDVYDLGQELLIISTDRLSAFDCILPTAIPDKGRILTQVSAYWFEKTKSIVPNHFLTADLKEIVRRTNLKLDAARYDGRTMLVRKAQRLDVECVARGYLAGSGWKEYQGSGKVCGHMLPAGLSEASKLPETIFTPAVKNDVGHDENISREKLAELVGKPMAEQLERLTLKLYGFASEQLLPRGLILADTKFEFGLCDGALIVIDEMLTPDSSRVWDAASWAPGRLPESFDKQFVRDYLEKSGWNKTPPPPALPQSVVDGTVKRYLEFLGKVTS